MVVETPLATATARCSILQLGEDADAERYVREILRVRSPDLLFLASLQCRLGTHPAVEQLHAETGVTAWRERARTL